MCTVTLLVIMDFLIIDNLTYNSGHASISTFETHLGVITTGLFCAIICFSLWHLFIFVNYTHRVNAEN